MIQTLETNPSTKRLKDIIQLKYGATLKIMPIADSNSLSNASGFYAKGDDLLIPIVVNDLFLSTAIVPRGNLLSSSDKGSISQLIRMVLDPVCYSAYLSSKERNLSSDPISTFYPFAGPVLVEALPKKRPLCTASIFSRSSNLMSFNKFAHNVHDITERWAMLRMDDLGDSLSSQQDLLDLGPITLLIPELRELNDLKIDLIRQYIGKNHASNDPLLLINSQSTLMELDREKNLGKEIMDHFLFNQIDLTSQVFTEERIREILEMLFYD